MSVYKSKRSESAMQFVETARQLEAHTFACCMKAPKRYSFLLTTRIMELALELYEQINALEAASAEQDAVSEEEQAEAPETEV